MIRRLAIAMFIAGCGNAATPPAAAETSTTPTPATPDAGIATTTPDASALEVIGGDATCAPFDEPWTIEGGKWAEVTRWLTMGAAPTITSGLASFPTNATSCMTHMLATNCPYAASVQVTLPAIGPGDDIVFFRLDAATPGGTVTYEWKYGASGKPVIAITYGDAATDTDDDYAPGATVSFGVMIFPDGGLTPTLDGQIFGGTGTGRLYSFDGPSTFISMHTLDIGNCGTPTSGVGTLSIAPVTVNVDGP